jgi:hypothetical protein
MMRVGQVPLSKRGLRIVAINGPIQNNNNNSTNSGRPGTNTIAPTDPLKPPSRAVVPTNNHDNHPSHNRNRSSELIKDFNTFGEAYLGNLRALFNGTKKFFGVGFEQKQSTNDFATRFRK